VIVVLVGLTFVAATACQTPSWMQARFDAGQTAANLGETHISAANIGTVFRSFTVAVASPAGVVTNGSRLFGRTAVGGQWVVFSADAAGHEGCSGTPAVCQPLWTAPLPNATSWTAANASTAYAIGGPDNGARHLAAYDANGVTGCGGAPVTCQPLWTTSDTGATNATLAGNRLYVIDGSSGLKVYDAAGSENCSGAPKVCAPLWTAPYSSYPATLAVAGGHVTVATLSGTATYDAAGVDRCTGSPAVCTPQWTVTLVPGTPTRTTAPIGVVMTSDQIVTVRQTPYPGPAMLQVSDAHGSIGCAAGACNPLWSAQLAASAPGLPAVGHDRIVVTSSSVVTRAVQSFDLRGGTATCAPSAYGVLCQPQWTNTDATSINGDDVMIANDVAVAGWTTVTITPEIETAHSGTQAVALDTGATTWLYGNDVRPLMISDGHLFLSYTSALLVKG
jgi:hypothetical protein